MRCISLIFRTNSQHDEEASLYKIRAGSTHDSIDTYEYLALRYIIGARFDSPR